MFCLRCDDMLLLALVESEQKQPTNQSINHCSKFVFCLRGDYKLLLALVKSACNQSINQIGFVFCLRDDMVLLVLIEPAHNPSIRIRTCSQATNQSATSSNTYMVIQFCIKEEGCALFRGRTWCRNED